MVVARITPIRKFATAPRTIRANAIAAFVMAEPRRWQEVFDTIESKPLAPEPRLSVVVDGDAPLVLAGVGQDPRIIAARTACLVKAGIGQPTESKRCIGLRNPP